MNFLRMLVELVLATLFPAYGRHRPRPVAPPPRSIPRQARRHLHAPTDRLARDFPEWRIIRMPTDLGDSYTAMNAGHLVHATTPEELRDRLHDVEETPPPAFVWRYLDAGALT